jgi:nucleotide-binding universal stress UspA family protein
MQEMAEAETEFRSKLRGRARSLSWHRGITTMSLGTAIANHARGADLLIAPIDPRRVFFESSSPLGVGDLIMKAGRPVLTVPSGTKKLSLDHILVGWKDGSEARRAVADSLPLLANARRVTVVEIASASELPEVSSRLGEVTAWLNRHNIAAEPLAPSSDGDDAERLPHLAAEQGADLIVAGAFAHSRFQEWVFRGVTRNLLFESDRCALVSH